MAVELASVTLRRAPRISGLRVLGPMLIVWAIGTCDLLITHRESDSDAFVELNPIAATIIGGPLYQLAFYKYSLLAFATLVLYLVRTQQLCVRGAWFLAGSHAVLALYWGVYFTIQT